MLIDLHIWLEMLIFDVGLPGGYRMDSDGVFVELEDFFS